MNHSVSKLLLVPISLLIAFFSHHSLADVVLPDIDPKFVTIIEENPTRDAGYVVGDIVERTVTITIKHPYQLVKESLPIVGYEHRWKGQISGIELSDIQTESSTSSKEETHKIHLAYQIFTTGKLAKPAALRAEILKVRNLENKDVYQLRIPSFSMRVSPLSVFGAVKLREEMYPFIPPLLISDQKQKQTIQLLSVLLLICILGLIYILGAYAWLPKMGGPFAKAFRNIRKLSVGDVTCQEAMSLIHEALNTTAGQSVFKDNLVLLFAKKPSFHYAEPLIQEFFARSHQTFFESTHPQKMTDDDKSWLLSVCKTLRDCERGLRPTLATAN